MSTIRIEVFCVNYRQLEDKDIFIKGYRIGKVKGIIIDPEAWKVTHLEVELSKVIKESLEPALFLELYPRTGVDVFVEVLQADGGTRCASITAAALAIADAGVPMRDLVVACAAGKIDDTVVLDLYDAEDKLGSADVPVAYMPNLNAITLLQMDGVLAPDEFEKAVTMAMEGCKQIYVTQKEALKTKYMVVKEAEE